MAPLFEYFECGSLSVLASGRCIDPYKSVVPSPWSRTCSDLLSSSLRQRSCFADPEAARRSPFAQPEDLRELS